MVVRKLFLLISIQAVVTVKELVEKTDLNLFTVICVAGLVK